MSGFVFDHCLLLLQMGLPTTAHACRQHDSIPCKGLFKTVHQRDQSRIKSENN